MKELNSISGVLITGAVAALIVLLLKIAGLIARRRRFRRAARRHSGAERMRLMGELLDAAAQARRAQGTALRLRPFWKEYGVPSWAQEWVLNPLLERDLITLTQQPQAGTGERILGVARRLLSLPPEAAGLSERSHGLMENQRKDGRAIVAERLSYMLTYMPGKSTKQGFQRGEGLGSRTAYPTIESRASASTSTGGKPQADSTFDEFRRKDRGNSGGNQDFDAGSTVAPSDREGADLRPLAEALREDAESCRVPLISRRIWSAADLLDREIASPGAGDGQSALLLQIASLARRHTPATARTERALRSLPDVSG